MVGVSTGLEPYFAFKYYRSGRLGKFMEVNAPIVEKYLSKHPEYTENNLPEIFVSAMDLTAEEHADVQCVIQRWVDSSISKTVNAPKGYTVEDVLNNSDLAMLTAVKEGKVLKMPSTTESWDSPVPSSVLGSVWLSSKLHPETTSEDFAKEVINEYEALIEDSQNNTNKIYSLLITKDFIVSSC